MGKIRRLVLDVLKPHQPTIIEWARQLSDLEGIDAVNLNVYEIDQKVENVKVTIQGRDISYDGILECIQENGGSLHSIDEVVAGALIIDESITLQDHLRTRG